MKSNVKVKGGFSLIEISLALLVVGGGMLTLFSLFPTGLKQVDTAHQNTQEAFFGEYVLSSLRAQAMKLDAEQWADMDPGDPAATFSDFTFGTVVDAFEFPEDSGLYMRYFLQLVAVNAHVWSVNLWCRSGEFGPTDTTSFQRQALSFHTKFFYSGMP